MRSQEELFLMYKKLNKSSNSFDRGLDVVDYFKEMVRKNPDKLALVYEDETITYKQLDEMSNRIANALKQRGVMHGDRVSVILNNKVDFIIAVIGIVKLNAAYVPIDPDYFDDRILFMIESSHSKIIIVDKDGKERFLDAVLYEDMLLAEETDLERCSCLDSVLCIMYTSGTTGSPKGVMIPQRGIVRLVVNGYYQYKEQDRMLQTSTVVFDISLQEIWGSLMNGITLYITNKQDILEVKRFEYL